MFAKRGQVWTYRERGRFLALTWGAPILVMLVVGAYFAVIGTTWMLLGLAVLALLGWVWFIFDSERRHRGEP